VTNVGLSLSVLFLRRHRSPSVALWSIQKVELFSSANQCASRKTWDKACKQRKKTVPFAIFRHIWKIYFMKTICGEWDWFKTPISLFEWIIQSTATCWYRELFPFFLQAKMFMLFCSPHNFLTWTVDTVDLRQNHSPLVQCQFGVSGPLNQTHRFQNDLHWNSMVFFSSFFGRYL